MRNQISIIFLGVLLAIVFWACAGRKATQNNKPVNPPEKLLTMHGFDPEWREIDSLLKRGLPKSALQKLNAIEPTIRESKHAGQLVKWVTTKVAILQNIEENSEWKNYQRFIEEIAKADTPAKEVLEFYLAQYMQAWTQQNLWRIRNRTAVADNEEEDLRTWSLPKLEQETNRLFQAAIANPKLKDLPVSAIDPLVVKGENTEGLRSSLYDLLAHEVLNYYSRENNFLTEPAYQFYVDDPEYFAEAKTFAGKQIVARDTASRKLAALHIFQELTKMHLDDVNPDALLDLDLSRLRFVYQNFVGEDKNSLYLDALNRLRKMNPDSPITAEVISAMVGVYVEEGRGYSWNAPNQAGKEANKKAVALAEEAIRTYPNSHGALRCGQQLAELKERKISMQAEDVYLPMTPGLIHLSYRNLHTVKLKIYQLDKPYQIFSFGQMEDEVAAIKKLPVVVEKVYALTSPEDYNMHSTELMMPSLPYGQYFLQILDNESGIESHVPFQVSNLAALKLSDHRNDLKFKILDRTRGLPVAGAELRSFRSIDYSKFDLHSEKVSTTDKQGVATLKMGVKGRGRHFAAIAKGQDLLVLDDAFYKRNYHPGTQKSSLHTKIFLDRAIYRPGQTVYFKAIFYELDVDRIPHIQAHKSLEVTLYDANRQKVKTIRLTTNEYGTANGEFKLPSSGMNGNFALGIKPNGWIGFRVEDYKRPKFEVKMNPPAKAYAIGEKVVVNGEAKNYSAAALDGATVKYVVTRAVRYPVWRSYGYWYNPAPPTQIAVGETVTNAEGGFELSFDALPDRSVDPKGKPNFIFNINVTVTDVTGEVHEASSSVTVGYVALDVAVDIPGKADVKDFSSFKIYTKNLNGKFVPAKGTIRFDRLQIPDKIFVNRYWEKPEYQIMSKPEFEKNLPDFAYTREDERAFWPVSSPVFEQSFDTQVSDSVSIKSKLNPGTYRLILNTKDRNNEPVVLVKYMELRSSASPYVFNHLFDVSPLKTKVEPGSLAKIGLASRDKVNYLVSTFRYKKERVDKTIPVRRAQKVVDYSVTEQDRGGFKTKVVAVSHNRFFSKEINFVVPWTNKELKITYTSFRDKLYPGQKEKWRIKIAGPKADAAAAEMVATLYDASLDQFVKHRWTSNFYPSRFFSGGWDNPGLFGVKGSRKSLWGDHAPGLPKTYDYLERLRLYSGRRHFRKEALLGEVSMRDSSMPMSAPVEEVADGVAVKANYKKQDANISDKDSNAPKPAESELSPRTNLKETVFFKPDLKTDAQGNVIIEFTMNEALTRWKFMVFAHDKAFRYAFSEKEVITQKELMVIPNPPRFLREFDEIEFSAKVVNLSDKDLHPNVQLQLLDELHTMPVYKWLDNPQFNKELVIPKGRSLPVSFRFKVPSVGQTPMIKWTLMASAGKYSDGESGYLPVVTNRMLVTETMPLPVKAKQKKTFVFRAMDKASQSKTLENQGFTLEFTANPAWYAVQALPYIMEYPHECSEQVFSRLYANTLATSIANSHPKIKNIFEKWRTTDTEALASNLSKNQELKSALLEETPWVLNAMNEEEQKKNIGLLFDLDRMAGEQEKAVRTLAERQSGDGGFPWFPGGRESWYITQYIVEGFGHLSHLGALNKQEHPQAWQVSKKAIKYIDSQLLAHYNDLAKAVKKGLTKWEDDHLDNMVIHYLYARSFFMNQELSLKLRKVNDYYLGQAKKYYLGKGLYQEGLLALALQRNYDPATAQEIMKSIKERSITNDELGMYWKQNYGYYWYQLPVETNALMIEAFDEILKDKEAVYQLKVWLLKNKQTTHWKTTKATASAVYALLMSGENWLLEDQPVDIKLGDMEIHPEHTQAGTGYFKESWDKETMPVNPSQITVNNPNSAIAWGAVYWQYFEDLDKVKVFKDTPLQLKKELYRETNSDRSSVLEKINEGDAIHVGDKLKMRIELRVDRAMEYVHMKDMRAAGLEPTNVLSQYKWQDGLGYYESTRDLATDFFFSYLRPGVYVFEYPLTAQLKGNFSNGVTTIQCMYAPEFSSHSEGVRIRVE